MCDVDGLFGRRNDGGCPHEFTIVKSKGFFYIEIDNKHDRNKIAYIKLIIYCLN